MEQERGGVNEQDIARAGLADRTAYLLPDYDSDDEAQELLGQFAELIFEEELSGWYTDETMWPPKRDLATFRTWFHAEFLSVVADTWEHPLELE